MIDDDDVDRVVERLRELWGVDSFRPSLTPEDQKVARKLLGQTGAERHARLRTGQRFKFRPSARRIEFYAFPPPTDVASPGIYWRLELVEDGRRHCLRDYLDDESCMRLVAKIKALGMPITELRTEWMRQHGLSLSPASRPLSKPRQERSKRFAMIEQLRGFKP